MELEPWEIRDPAGLIRQIGERVTLEEDTAHVGVVHLTPTPQRLVDLRRLDLPALLEDDDDISRHLRVVAESFGIRHSGPIEHKLITVVVRPGFAVFGPNEAVWFTGWRYSNHFQSMFTSDVFLVTEHGWVHFESREAGAEPRMRVAS